MRKISAVLALLMILSCFAMTGAMAAEGGTVYSFAFGDGYEFVFEQGKNGKCYFPNPEKKTDAPFPEVYTWGTATLSSDIGVTKVDISKNSGMLEFDTIPKGMNFATTQRYVALILKSNGKKDNVTFSFVSQGSDRYKKDLQANLSGEWQRVILNLSQAEGWQVNKAGAGFTASAENPWEINKIHSGGFRIDISNGSYHLESIGFFASEDEAKAYKPTVEVKESITATVVGGASAGTTTSTTPAPSTLTPLVSTKEEWTPTIFNAIKNNEKAPASGKEFVSVVPYGASNDDDKFTVKFQTLTSENGKAFNTGMDKNKLINTYGAAKSITMESGILKLVNCTLFEMTHFGLGFNSKKYPYLVIGYMTPNMGGTKTCYIYSAANKYRTKINLTCDGEWHYDIFHIDDASIIEVDSGDKKYSPVGDEAPNVGYGAFRIDFPKFADEVVFYVDYIAGFKSEDDAKNLVSESVKNLANNFEEEEAEEETGFSYIKGYSDNTFKPQKNMTRAEAITVVSRLVGTEEEIAKATETKFTDATSHWAKNNIAYLESFGMLNNYSGTIEPDKNITRAEFIKLAYEADAFGYSNKRPMFTDLDTKHPYYKELCLGYAAGAITGYTDNTLRPDKEITRAEIVTIINRILKVEASTAEPTFTDIADHWAKGNIMAAVGK